MIIIFNLLTWLIAYMAIPVIVRFLILRRPTKTRWAAILIMLPIFVFFGIVGYKQKLDADKIILKGTPLENTRQPHIFGSALLFASVWLGYNILRRKNKDEVTDLRFEFSELGGTNIPLKDEDNHNNVEWYYSDDSQRKGPCSLQLIINQMKASKIGKDTLVWKQGMPDWLPISQTELNTYTIVTPPPLPSQKTTPPSLPAATTIQPPPLRVPQVSASPTPPPTLGNKESTDDALFKSIGLSCLVVVLMVAAVIGLIFVSSIFDSGKNSNPSTNNSKGLSDKTQAGLEYDKSASFVIVDVCNDNDKTQFKFYDVTNNLVYPSDNRVYIAEEYNYDYTSKLACKDGSIICYGAKSVNGKYSWGAGLDNTGNYDTSNDCIPCGSNNVLIKRLSCD